MLTVDLSTVQETPQQYACDCTGDAFAASGARRSADNSVDRSPRTMQCLEVWGGNRAVDRSVVMPGLDAWLYSRPSHGDQAGGDIHYVSSCAAGLLTRVLVADVSGHGEAVSGVADQLRSLMRRYVNYVDQTQLVQQLNAEFQTLSHEGGFATAIAATYHAPDDMLTVSNAGHPQPLWYSAKTNTWNLLHGFEHHDLANTPLGIVDTRYDEINMKFREGDMLVLYTDSLIESCDASGRVLGREGLLHTVRQFGAGDPEAIMAGLLDLHHSRAPASDAGEDDITVLVLRANDLKPRVTLSLMLKMHWLLLREMIAGLRPGAPAFPWPDAGPLVAVRRFVGRIRGREQPDPGLIRLTRSPSR